jgi:hypothetical protein
MGMERASSPKRCFLIAMVGPGVGFCLRGEPQVTAKVSGVACDRNKSRSMNPRGLHASYVFVKSADVIVVSVFTYQQRSRCVTKI